MLLGWALLNGCGPSQTAGPAATPTATGDLRPVVSTSLPVGAGQLVTPLPTQPTGEAVAVHWERSGGLAGVCWQLDLGYSGAYRLEDCRPGGTPGEGVLVADDLETLQDWIHTYTAFAWQAGPVPADGFADRYQINGQGSNLPDAEAQTALNEALAALAGRLRPPPTPTPAGASGITGRAMIGPACGGPVRVDRPCPDQPYPAEFAILDADGREAARIQADAQGYFQAALPAGTYTLHPVVQGALPRAADLPFTVQAGEYTPVEIHFDSGIR